MPLREVEQAVLDRLWPLRPFDLAIPPLGAVLVAVFWATGAAERSADWLWMWVGAAMGLAVVVARIRARVRRERRSDHDPHRAPHQAADVTRYTS